MIKQSVHTSIVGEGSVVTTLKKNRTPKTGFSPPVCHIGHYVSIEGGCVSKSCGIDDLLVVGEKCTTPGGCCS
jgi:hypothetical protein